MKTKKQNGKMKKKTVFQWTGCPCAGIWCVAVAFSSAVCFVKLCSTAFVLSLVGACFDWAWISEWYHYVHVHGIGRRGGYVNEWVLHGGWPHGYNINDFFSLSMHTCQEIMCFKRTRTFGLFNFVFLFNYTNFSSPDCNFIQF